MAVGYQCDTLKMRYIQRQPETKWMLEWKYEGKKKSGADEEMSEKLKNSYRIHG